MNQNQFTPDTNKESLTTKPVLHSRFVILALLITIPLISFWLGTKYVAAPETVDENVASESASTTESSAEATGGESDAPGDTQQPQAASYTPPASPRTLTVFIEEMTLDYIAVDNIAIYEDEAAINRMIADGLCTAAEADKCRLEGGRYYRNTDPTIIRYPVADDVDVRTWTGTEYSIGKMLDKGGTRAPYTITINGAGVVIQIKEVYRG